MKALALLLLLGVTSCTAYLYAYDPIIDWVGLNRTGPSLEAVATSRGTATASVTVPAPPPLPSPPGTSATTATLTKPPTPEPSLSMASTQSAVMPPSSVTENTPKPDADGFTPPTFLPLEDVVKNWTQVPVTAFPREVRVMKSVEFVTVLSGGNKMSSKVPAGSHVQAIEQEGSMLVIAMSVSSPARVQVLMDDTDFKAVLTEAYEQWKLSITERSRKSHLAMLAARKRAANSPTNKAADAPGAPTRNAEGTYDMLLASMKAGQVTDITPQNVRKWGEPVREEMDGKVYWMITVDVTVQTAFGPIDAQAVAHIHDGKVEKWLYTSGEEVP
ncbi:hypothetical protein DES53_102711 [Roseimicrobium gellanilyticum]|uniref:Uncharacterized protein n=1 Tax=Roseimicrobium gellanilyticum TaxID=748857 RepID=A0A366HRL6_9BACT|nr:hypothetical protein [Roseimicrobium gellanilyticum]RBP46322.1 hypothetical protein DES53_102711 [Roseimicrobium gellanilyticum]